METIANGFELAGCDARGCDCGSRLATSLDMSKIGRLTELENPPIRAFECEQASLRAEPSQAEPSFVLGSCGFVTGSAPRANLWLFAC